MLQPIVCMYSIHIIITSKLRMMHQRARVRVELQHGPHWLRHSSCQPPYQFTKAPNNIVTQMTCHLRAVLMPYLIKKVGIHHCVGLHVELQHGPRRLRHTSRQPLPHVADSIGRSVRLRRLLLLLALQHLCAALSSSISCMSLQVSTACPALSGNWGATCAPFRACRICQTLERNNLWCGLVIH